MRVCVIDGHGGGLGRRLIQGLRDELGRDHELIALGTNQTAVEAMRIPGMTGAVMGPEAIAGTVQTADIIVTSLNVLLPHEESEDVMRHIVKSILESRGTKILLPVNQYRLEVAGTQSSKLEQLIASSLSRVRVLVSSEPAH